MQPEEQRCSPQERLVIVGDFVLTKNVGELRDEPAFTTGPPKERGRFGLFSGTHVGHRPTVDLRCVSVPHSVMIRGGRVFVDAVESYAQRVCQ